jgi:peptide deformylase
MAILNILLEGDPRLREKSLKIKNVDDGLRALAADMRETMLDAPGVGLAAPQIGVNRRLIVVHVPAGHDDEDDPEIDLALVNPEIVRAQGRAFGIEGCLSIPGWIGEVPRADRVTVKAQDLDGKAIRIKAEGFPARVLQHEIDHLDGILYVDLIEDRSTLRRESDVVEQAAAEEQAQAARETETVGSGALT